MERTLLLVDDEENIASALTRLLRRDGYRILRANSGREGLELLAQHQAGVIISDQRMPGMTGTEFLTRVKELYPDTMRIVLSGYTELNSVTDAINRGAIYKFLTKPWEDDLLRTNVEEAFRLYEMKQENARLHREALETGRELQRLNRQLEGRVEGNTSLIEHNLSVLLVAQEILEHLPVAVIGTGEDGMIAVANQMAHQLLGAGEAQPLLGEAAEEAIPAELLGHANGQQCIRSSLADGREIACWRRPMGELSCSRGMILVCMPVDAAGNYVIGSKK